METLFDYGLAGVLAYGSVGMLALILSRRFKFEMTSEVKLYAMVIFAFLYLFIPVEFGNIIFEKIKIAVGIAAGITALNTVANKVGGRG
jgi:hypothetical protein